MSASARVYATYGRKDHAFRDRLQIVIPAESKESSGGMCTDSNATLHSFVYLSFCESADGMCTDSDTTVHSFVHLSF